jgi:hypothetical protein
VDGNLWGTNLNLERHDIRLTLAFLIWMSDYFDRSRAIPDHALDRGEGTA